MPILLVLAHPRGRATLRLVHGFTPLPEDARVYHETGAEELARRLARALPSAVTRVEQCQVLPLKSGFRVYVCATHESFSRRIGQSASWPVRGIAFLRDVWVSPKAFAFYGEDTHRQSLAHELSHLHWDQHLGWWRRTRNVPAWFMEGLADWVADTGHERISRPELLAQMQAGRLLTPDATGHLPLPKRPQDYGLTAPEFHLQSRMFIEHLLGRDETALRGFVGALVSGQRFEAAFRTHFADSLQSVWEEFVASLGLQARPVHSAE